MFKNKVYKRFEKLYNYITDINCSYTREFDGICYKYKKFNTKLGERAVISHKIGEDIVIGYHDEDNSLLFYIGVNKKGKVQIVDTKIDELAIFSAIYELECIIYKHKAKKFGKMLENMFKYYQPHNGIGLFIGKA